MNQSANNNGSSNGKLDALSADDLRERLWAYEDFAAAEQQEPYNVAGVGSFASLGYIGAALRRTRPFWLACMVIGFVAGLGVYVKFPVSYSATVSILVKNNPGQDAVAAMQTQLQLVESQTVAANTVKTLGLNQSVSSFQAAYTAKVGSSQVISITLDAPTATGAINGANTIANQYLKFRANMLLAQQALDVAAYAKMIPAAQQQIASLQQQISRLQGQPGQDAAVAKLQNQLTTATQMLPTIEQSVTGLTTEEQATTSGMIDGTQVLDAATVGHHSNIKDLIEYVLAGLVGGLAIGVGIVVVRELTTDRLRRRDDIAAALGAPVRLSVGPVRKRRIPLVGRSAADRNRALGRVTLCLRSLALRQAGEPATLAIVPVDNAVEVAPAVAALARQCAKDGFKIVVADLVKGAPVARLLGARGPGVQPVSVGDASVVVVTPKDGDQVPSGPLRPAGAVGAGLLAEPLDEAVESVAKKAKILLTVVELDPSVGAEHLGTWATQAVAVFTAGRTRTVRAYAVGEMLRLSGVRTVSGVIVAADKSDESLGLAPDDPGVLAGFRSLDVVTAKGDGHGSKGDGPATGGNSGASLS